MLTAIVRGKAGRVRLPGSEADISWRDVFRLREDLMTAVFFGRLRYLSDAALARVMGALVGDAAATELGAWEGIEFWSRLQGLDGRSWVEPDVLLRFEGATVMVEVKPPFGGEQTVGQWKAELDALVAEFVQDRRPISPVVHFVALGRNARVRSELLGDFDTQGLFELVVHCREWEPLAALVPEWAAESSRSDAAVFEDWVEAFGLFGLQTQRRCDWSLLANWATKHPISLDVVHIWPRPVAEPARAHAMPRWGALVEFTCQFPMELQPWT